MQAAKQPQVHSQPLPQPPKRSAPRRVPLAAVKQSVVLEATVKLTVNLLLAVVAGSTLAKLIPYYRTQAATLKTQQTTVEILEREHTELWDDFSRNFDPQQASSVIQEHSGQVEPNQRTVVWINPLEDR